jgi:hypothetical protein
MSEVSAGARPEELVPGDPDDVERLAARLARFAASSGEAAARLDRIDTEAWSGEAGELFREAVAPVPARLASAAAAFTTATRALSAYSRVLREGQATATRAIRLVEESTPQTETADRQTAAQWVARARTEVEEAGRAVAARLAEAAADAPAGEGDGDRAFGSGVSVRLVTAHELTDPDRFVSPPRDWVDSIADVRYTEPHEVGFVEAPGRAVAQVAAVPSGDSLPVPDGDASTRDAAWQAWAGADSGRQLGAVEPATLAAVGVTAVGLTVLGRGRRDSSAMALVDLNEPELRRRRDEFGGARHRDGVLAQASAGQQRGAGTWRTRLASPPRAGGTVQHWTGPVGGPAQRVRVAGEPLGSVDREVGGAVPRTGRAAGES